MAIFSCEIEYMSSGERFSLLLRFAFGPRRNVSRVVGIRVGPTPPYGRKAVRQEQRHSPAQPIVFRHSPLREINKWQDKHQKNRRQVDQETFRIMAGFRIGGGCNGQRAMVQQSQFRTRKTGIRRWATLDKWKEG
jgi:hypothetical protein